MTVAHPGLPRVKEIDIILLILLEQFQEKWTRFSVRNAQKQKDRAVHRFHQSGNRSIEEMPRLILSGMQEGSRPPSECCPLTPPRQCGQFPPFPLSSFGEMRRHSGPSWCRNQVAWRFAYCLVAIFARSIASSKETAPAIADCSSRTPIAFMAGISGCNPSRSRVSTS